MITVYVSVITVKQQKLVVNDLLSNQAQMNAREIGIHTNNAVVRTYCLICLFSISGTSYSNCALQQTDHQLVASPEMHCIIRTKVIYIMLVVGEV